jgi:hypothetical protein
MRRTAGPTAVLVMAIGLSGCGKYGPPVRSVPQQFPSASEASRAETPEPEPSVPEERITEPADFDDSPAAEEDPE